MYIHTLLKHGYGFPGDSRNITFVLNIDNTEVEWTLGYALSEVPIYKLEPSSSFPSRERTEALIQQAPLLLVSALALLSAVAAALAGIRSKKWSKAHRS